MSQRDKIIEVLHKSGLMPGDSGCGKSIIAEAILEVLTEGGEPDAQAIISKLEDEINCAEVELDSAICDLPDGQTEFDCIGDYIKCVHQGMKAIIAQKEAEIAELRCQWKAVEGDLHHMTAACNEAEAERDALRKDAELYRGLCDMSKIIPYPSLWDRGVGFACDLPGLEVVRGCISKETLDKAIANAIAAQSEVKG